MSTTILSNTKLILNIKMGLIMKILQTKIFFQISVAMTVVGFSLCLGSIASFIALNIIAGKAPTIEFWYWQRLFINSIMYFVTIPGTWLFLLGNIGIYLKLKGKRKPVNIILLMLSFLLLLNGYWIQSVAKTVSNLAVEQLKTNEFIQAFSSNKSIEDICGGINLLFLLVYLGIYIITIAKSKK